MYSTRRCKLKHMIALWWLQIHCRYICQHELYCCYHVAVLAFWGGMCLGPHMHWCTYRNMWKVLFRTWTVC